MKTSVIFNGKTLCAVINGKQYTINDTHPNWGEAIAAYKGRDWKHLIDCMDLPEAVERYSFGKVKVCEGAVFYDGNPVHGTLVARILQFMKDGFPFHPYVVFLNNLYKNPWATAREELYDFLEKGGMPITDDGCFLAYKKVGPNMHSLTANPDGTYNDERIGKVVKMKRELCDPSRHNTCSRGLHFCSFNYLDQYSGTDGFVVVKKVNPRDVTAIPSDHNDTKGRCCEYVTTSVVGKLVQNNILTGKLYSGKTNGRLRAFQPKRDKFGRFSCGKRINKPLRLPKRDDCGRFVSA